MRRGRETQVKVMNRGYKRARKEWPVQAAGPRNFKKKEESLRHRISLQGQTVVTAVFKSMADAWRNTLKSNVATSDDL